MWVVSDSVHHSRFGQRGAAGRAALGRPRDEQLTMRLLDSALDLLVEEGFEHVHPEALAARTGAGKGSIYRRWPTMADLVAEGLAGRHLIPAAPDTGAPRSDLVAALEPWYSPVTRDERAAGALLGAAHHHPAVHHALTVAVVDPLQALAGTLTARQARRRGLDIALDRGRLLGVLLLALWWDRCARTLLPLTGPELDHLVDTALLPVLHAR